METSTTSGLLCIRLLRFMEWGFQIRSDSAQSQGTKLSALLLNLPSLVPFTQPVSVVLSSPFFLIPVMVLLIQSHRHIQDPFSPLQSCFKHHYHQSTWIPNLSFHSLPCSMSVHSNFTVSSIPTSLSLTLCFQLSL